jgi:hypothetical protein
MGDVGAAVGIVGATTTADGSAEVPEDSMLQLGMDWFTLVSNVVTGVGIAGALGLSAAWLGKQVAEKWIESRVELYKEQLARESHAYRVRFESLHAKRAAAILDNWLAFKKAIAAGGAFVSPMQGSGEGEQEKIGIEAQDLAHKARLVAYETTIFFPKSTGDRLYEFAKELDVFCFSMLLDYRMAKKDGRNPYFGVNGGQSTFGTGWEQLKTKIRPLLLELEGELQMLLGVEQPTGIEKPPQGVVSKTVVVRRE